MLERHWGHTRFREGQWEVVERILAGRDVLAVLPTGGGKSICYQIPALMREGVTLVVSPLIALMQDQVNGLREAGIPAISINSALSKREIDQAWTDVEFGRYRLVYVSPERLKNETFLARVERLPIRLVAVDEAHCISEWGMNFRPSYLDIAEVRPHLSDDVPFVAFTATATPPVRDDIHKYLALRDPFVYVKGFDRPNLIWTLFHTDNKRGRVTKVLKGVDGSGIIYAATRNGVVEWAEWLQEKGYSVAHYHGGMPASQRNEEAQAWVAGEKRLMVATNAFGMGIDKPDVRFVVHVHLPGALEAYYQEAGRAGRDGQKAYAVLLYHQPDEDIQRGLIDDAHPEPAVLRAVYDAVCTLSQVALGDLPEVPLTVFTGAVARHTGLRAPLIRSSVEMLARLGVWSIVPLKRQQVHLQFLQPPPVIRQYAGGLNNERLKTLVEVLLRTVHGDAFTDWWEVDIRIIERKMGADRSDLYEAFDFLESRELLRWFPPGGKQRVFLTAPRTKKLVVDASLNRKAKKRALGRFKDMKRYVYAVSCRRHFLLQYFGESSPERCGRCDVCMGRHEELVVTPDDEPALRRLLQLIQQAVPADRLDQELGRPDHVVEGYLRWLIQEEYVDWGEQEPVSYVVTTKAQRFLEEWTPEINE